MMLFVTVMTALACHNDLHAVPLCCTCLVQMTIVALPCIQCLPHSARMCMLRPVLLLACQSSTLPQEVC